MRSRPRVTRRRSRFETLSVRPTKQNVTVKLVALAWAPAWRDSQGHITDAWR